MKLFLALIIAATSFSTQADVLSTRYEFDMGKTNTMTYRQCNDNDVDKSVEVGVVEYTAGNIHPRSATEFLVLPPIEKIKAHECQNFRVMRVDETGVRVFHLDVATYSADVRPGTNRIEIEPRLQPVLFVGNDTFDKAGLSIKLLDNGLEVQNNGKRPGRVVSVLIDDVKHNFELSWNVLPGQTRTIGISPNGIKEIREAIKTGKKVAFIDRVGQEVPML